MIYVYTGDGKGKTSACLGQIMRAKGRGLKAAFIQFMKQDGEAGEQIFLKELLGDNFKAAGKGFFRKEEERPEHREAAGLALAWTRDKMGKVDVLVADEILYALGKGLVLEEELKALLELSKKSNTHFILSGRGFPPHLTQDVDLITEMKEVKHPWHEGKKAVPGLDF
ncbi:MAG TPA: cob(I)yrinic acid a,c-diamide adenosyltransferase [Candidatus Mailhella merdavium]|nr:cob(I)yrinic acid a,c-diamide adenosyltransferase [Candidatus Mailhella merdavium]